MTEVLGIAVGTFQRSYLSVCQKYSLDPQAQWSPEGKYQGLPFRRYSWEQYTRYLDGATRHLRENQIDPIEIQQKNLPTLFEKLGYIRFSPKFFGPKSVIKFVDQYAGPLMFNCLDSTYLEEAPNIAGFELKIQPGFRHSTAFFDFCVTGTIASISYLGWLIPTIESMHVSDCKLKVLFKVSTERSSDPTSTKAIEPDADELNRYDRALSDLTKDESSELFAYLKGLAKLAPHPKSLELIDELTILWSNAQFDKKSSQNGACNLSSQRDVYRDLVSRITALAQKP